MSIKVSPRSAGPKVHLPVAIVIDRSESTGDIQSLLNQCAQKLIRNMKGHLLLNNVVDLLVVFYNHEYETAVDFLPLSQVGEHDLDIHDCWGTTATGTALLYALQRLDEKKAEWHMDGEEYRQPMLFLLTDGYPSPGYTARKEYHQLFEDQYARAADQIRSRELENKLVFMAAGIQQSNGECADMEKLKQLTNYPDHILRVSDVVGEFDHVERFYDLIYLSTNAMFENTPIDSVVGGFFVAGRKGSV